MPPGLLQTSAKASEGPRTVQGAACFSLSILWHNWTQHLSLSPGRAPAHTAPGAAALLGCWPVCSTSRVLLPFHPGARSVQPRASGNERFTPGSPRDHSCPVRFPDRHLREIGVKPRKEVLGGREEPVGVGTLQSCCPGRCLVQRPKLIKAFSSGAPALCSAAGPSPCPSVPGPHYFISRL